MKTLIKPKVPIIDPANLDNTFIARALVASMLSVFDHRDLNSETLFHEVFRNILDRKFFSVDELADVLDYSVSHITKIRAGKHVNKIIRLGMLSAIKAKLEEKYNYYSDLLDADSAVKAI